LTWRAGAGLRVDVAEHHAVGQHAQVQRGMPLCELENGRAALSGASYGRAARTKCFTLASASPCRFGFGKSVPESVPFALAGKSTHAPKMPRARGCAPATRHASRT